MKPAKVLTDSPEKIHGLSFRPPSSQEPFPHQSDVASQPYSASKPGFKPTEHISWCPTGAPRQTNTHNSLVSTGWFRPVTWGFMCGRYRTRTCDPLLVREVL
jgi:hypothetical protein